jgi:ABC-2 type transport system ATP-binding protein
MLAIETRDLHVTYPAWRRPPRHAVRGIDLRVEPGEVVGFLGPNGAGKSSTMKVLMGFRRPTSGTAALFGVDSQLPAARVEVGYLPEVALYYPWLTARETLTMYGELQGLDGAALRSRVEELLERVRLQDRQHERLIGYSKGMLHRVGIAQAILGKPRLLILDEVTSGLDPLGRREVRDLLLEQREAGVTIFFSSHELAEVAALCDRIVVIHQGRIVAEEQVPSLVSRLERFTLSGALRSPAAPPPNGALRHALSGVRRRHGRWYAEFATEADRAAAVEALTGEGYADLELGRREGDLEEFFVGLVGGEHRCEP